ncbi:MAG: hypothetical protein ACO3EK_14895, partial [Alphaproteobacteria bacterium]
YLMGFRTTLVLLLVAAVLGACGSGEDARDPGAFCDRIRVAQPALTDASDPAALLALYEDLDGPSTEKLIDELAAGRVPPRGSPIGRQKSAPEGGPQVLKAMPPRYEWTLEPPPAPPAGSDD